jgi:hypothetical protein
MPCCKKVEIHVILKTWTWRLQGLEISGLKFILGWSIGPREAF